MERLFIRGIESPVSRIAFGAEPLGGYEWGVIDFEEIERAVEIALDLGINLFDTADCYGQGESERRLGRVLANRRHQAVIATKFGVRFDDSRRVFYENAPAYIEEALCSSLKRLGTDYIDLYQLHWWDERTPLDEVFDCLDRLRKAGKIRAYGVTNITPEALCPHADRSGLASFSLQYSLAHRQHEAAIRGLCEAGLTFLSWGSLGQGVLSGQYALNHSWHEGDRRRRKHYQNFHGENLVRNLTLVERLRSVASRENYSAPAVGALRFILDNISGSVAIVGIKSCAQLAQNAQAGERPMMIESLNSLVAEVESG